MTGAKASRRAQRCSEISAIVGVGRTEDDPNSTRSNWRTCPHRRAFEEDTMSLWQLACTRAGRARQRAVATIAALALVSIIGTAPSQAQNAYITNSAPRMC